MSPEDSIHIQHVLDALDAALGFVAERQRLDLDSDRMLAFALVRAVEIVGRQPRCSLPKAALRSRAFPGGVSSV